MIFRANYTSRTSSTNHLRPSCLLHSLIVMDAIERQQMITHSCVTLMANSILMYDHLATLSDEIIYIWHRPKALSAISFFINRYFALFSNIFGLFVAFMPIPDQSCWKYMVFRQLFVFLQQVIICVILIIRTYALYNRNKYLLAWISFTLIILAGGAGAVTIGQNAGNLKTSPGIGCYGTYTVESSIRFGLAWLALFAFEFLIFVLTIHRACKTRDLLRLHRITKKTALDVMFQDGAMYFGAMALCNVPNIVMYFSTSGVINGNPCMATFTSCMSVTLISRLMLNLHKSIDSGTFSIPAQDDNDHLSVLITTRINIQSETA